MRTSAQITRSVQDNASNEADKLLSLYVHVPFCKTRCSYCAFVTYTGLDNLIPPFVHALCREIELVAGAVQHERLTAHTLYFGGGTPSLLDPSQVETIIHTCHDHFSLLRDSEITLEVNPGSVDKAKLDGFRAAGVNRLSIGVQSAHESELEMFGRNHSFEDAAQTFQLARKAGFENISLDLIYGAPHQTRAGWRNSLKSVLAWEPDHISLYSLTLEPQTLLARQVSSDILPAPDPDLAADMYEDAQRYCTQADLSQYEISNWAREGLESRHNRQYWLNEPFLGFGPGAHGAASGIRYWNIKPVHEFIARMEAGRADSFPCSPACADYETIDAELAMAETMILGLRLVQEGVDCASFERRFGKTPDEVYSKEISLLTSMGLLYERDGHLRLTERAYLVSNQVFMRFMPDR